MYEGKNREIIRFSGGEVYLWVEHETSVMLKAVTTCGDPVELFSPEVRELGETLIKMAAQIK
jgi:hypothetical protein